MNGAWHETTLMGETFAKVSFAKINPKKLFILAIRENKSRQNFLSITLKEESVCGRKFCGFCGFVPNRKSLFPQNIVILVNRKSFFPQNIHNYPSGIIRTLDTPPADNLPPRSRKKLNV